MKFSISTLILLLAFTGLSASNPPVIVCLNGLSANIMVTGQITIWTSDLVAYATDDETPYIDLVMGMRIAGTGSGFPSSSSFTFTCDNVGENEMELWVMDADGNTAYCTTTVIIMDAFNVCPDQTPPILTSLNDVSVSMSQTGGYTLLASDLYVWAEDNVTPEDDLEIAIRVAGEGSGFPVDSFGQPQQSITLNCNYLGDQFIEIWVRDAAGNASYTVSSFHLDDPEGVCDQALTLDASAPANKIQTLVCIPNPATAASRLALPALNSNSNWTITINDLSGRQLVREQGAGNSFDLNGKNPGQGLFFVRIVEKDGKVYAGKLVITE